MVDRLNRGDRIRILKAFLMVARIDALGMVVFAQTGQLDFAANVVAIFGIVTATILSAALWIYDQPALLVYGLMFVGLGAVVGTVGGRLVIQLVIPALFWRSHLVELATKDDARLRYLKDPKHEEGPGGRGR